MRDVCCMMHNTSCDMRLPLVLFIFVSYYVIIIALVCCILLRLLVITANWRGERRGWVSLPTSRSPVHDSVVSVRLYLYMLPERALCLDRFALFFTLCLSAGRCDLHACAAQFIPTSIENARF